MRSARAYFLEQDSKIKVLNCCFH